MFRYQIIIEFDGTKLCWLAITKKCKINSKRIRKNHLYKILREKVSIYGSGRTDAGVHAKNQSAHFDCKKLISNKFKFILSANHFLNKKNISIKKNP